MKQAELSRPKGGADVLCWLQTLNNALGKEEEDAVLDTTTDLIYNEMTTLVNHNTHSHPALPDNLDPIVTEAVGDGKKEKAQAPAKDGGNTGGALGLFLGPEINMGTLGNAFSLTLTHNVTTSKHIFILTLRNYILF